MVSDINSITYTCPSHYLVAGFFYSSDSNLHIFVSLIFKDTWFYVLFQKITEIAHSQGALVLVDNSIMSPVLSLPLELGAGILK